MPIRTVKTAEERKKEIIETAGGLFLSKGYMNTTVEDVIRETGIAKGTFYYHFPSKDELLRSVLESRLEALERQALQIAGHPGWNADEKLRAVLQAIFSSGEAGREQESPGNPELDTVMHVRLTQMFYDKMETALVLIVEQGIREGLYSVPSPREVTILLLRGITGYVQHHLSRPSDSESRGDMMAVIDYVLRSALRRKNE